MSVVAIITLCLLGAALIAFGVILAVMGGKPKYFKGKRFTGVSGALKTTFIVGSATGISVSPEFGEGAARYCSVVNNKVRSAFGDIATARALKKTEHVIVQLMDNDAYVKQGGKRHREYYEHSAACIRKTPCWFWGDEIPTVCVRVSSKIRLGEVFDLEGEPLIHELCHAYLDDYAADKNDHADLRVWVAAGGQAGRQVTVQERARANVLAYSIRREYNRFIRGY